MRFFTLFIIFIFTSSVCKSQNIINIDTDDSLIYIGKYCQLKLNDHHNISIDQIIKETEFDAIPDEHVLLGNTSSKNIWLKFTLHKKIASPTFLELTFPMIDTARLYVVENGIVTDMKVSGQNTVLGERSLHTNNIAFELKNSDKPVTYFINAQVRWNCNIKPRIGTYKALFKEYHYDNLLQGLFVGIILVLVLYNFFLFLRLKEIVYVLYSGYLFFISCIVFRYHGFLIEFLFTNHPEINDFTMICPSLAGIFSILFTSKFLNTRTELPVIHKILWVTLALYCINSILALVGYMQVSFLAVHFIMPICTVCVIFAAIKLWRKGNPTAKYYLMGWSCLSIGTIVFVLENTGVIPYNNFTAYALQIGISMEAMLLSYAIAHRFGTIKEEQELYRIRMLESMMQNQELINQHNRLLEQMVAERTHELQKALGNVHIKEEELKEYAYRLEVSNKELTEFAHIASHDLKAPLRSILSFAQLFERRNKDKFDNTDREYFNFIKTNAEQSSRLIEDLLNYSKIDKNLGEPIKVDVNKCVFIAEMNMQSFIREHNAVITYENLPILRGHTLLITQLFQNLINNAIKYNISETPTIHINVEYNDHNEYVFLVSDNGIGIAPENHEKIFAMFRRLHAQNEYEGTGIGLSFCTRIVENYGGRIWIESNSGMGSIFCFTLPKAKIAVMELVA